MEGIKRIRTNSISNVDCVDLENVLNAFSAPCNEEQAWGLCCQCAVWVRDALRRDGTAWLAAVSLSSLSDLLLSKDGQVRLKPKSEESEGRKDESLRTEHQLVQSLGRIIYSCLDYGLGKEEERDLSESLEYLIMQMTSDPTEGDESLNTDEGIGDGSNTDSSNEGDKIETFSHVIKYCSKHVSHSSDAPSHYQAVCKALYAEVEELKTFLDKIAGSKQILRKLADGNNRESIESHVEELRPQEWGRIWMQVLRDLRHGIHLRKVSRREASSFEYELTPYEIMMGDIRSKRYSLKQVTMTDGISPTVRKEAHDIILDFIRSRPPLRKVPEEEREQSRGDSQHERIMKEIRSQPKLNPASERQLPKRRPKKRREGRTDDDNSSSSGSEYDYSYLDSPKIVRKKIEPGISFSWSASETEPDTEEEGPHSPNGAFYLDAETERKLMDLSGCLEGAPQISPTHSSVSSFDELQDIDFCMESPRRHSVSLCQIEPWWNPFQKAVQPNKYLSLNVEEVTHIRSVLVKAELENIRMNQKLLELVINEKVCFCCKKKFSLFGRRCRCHLCRRLVCSICSLKMMVPKKTFLSFPVEALSPTSSPKRTPVRKARSLSEPPTPNLTPQPSPSIMRKEAPEEGVIPKEDVCIQCRDFLRNALRSETRGGLPLSPSFDEDIQSRVRFKLPDDHR